jgi:hypothetical protein
MVKSRLHLRSVAAVAAVAVAVGLVVAALAIRRQLRRRRKEGFLPLWAVLAAVGTTGNVIGAIDSKKATDEELWNAAHSRPVDETTGNRVKVYEDSNFTGASSYQFDKPGVVHDLLAPGWHDRISSIKVPAGRSVRLWQDTKGQGAFIDLPPGNWDLWQLDWNDAVSSMMTWPRGVNLPPIPVQLRDKMATPPPALSKALIRKAPMRKKPTRAPRRPVQRRTSTTKIPQR